MMYPDTLSTGKYRQTAGLLAIFGGMFGLHNFYLGNRDKAITQLLITVLGSFCVGLGPCITFIWGIVEGIQILNGTITADAKGLPILNPDYAAQGSKSKIIAGVLGMYLGFLGVHNFYLGNTGKAVAQLLLGTIGSAVGIGPIISMIWGIIESVQILSGEVTVDGHGIPIIDPANDGTRNKSKTAAGILSFTLGVFGMQNFYLGNTNKAVAQLLLGTVGAIVIVGPIIAQVWGIIDGIAIISGSVVADAENNLLIAD